MSEEIQLGDEVEEVTSGIIGIVIAKVEYLSGKIQYGLQPRSSDSVNVPEVYYADIAYVLKKGKGVRVKPEINVMGFNARMDEVK